MKISFFQLSRNIAFLSLAVFLSDVSNSVVIPIFPWYAQSLGASLSMIGSFSSVAGLTMLFFAIPLGQLSDKFGRRTIMIPGLVMYILVPIAYTVVTSPFHFYPIRVVFRIAGSMFFANGFLLMSEITKSEERPFAQGIYMTAMGLGATVGPLIGGYASRYYGVTTTFIIASSFSAVGLLLIFLVKEDIGAIKERNQVKYSFKNLIRDLRVLNVCMSNFLNTMMYLAVVIFFPVFARNMNFDESQIGTGLSIRGLVSTVVRLPVGSIVKIIPIFTLMLGALFLSGVSLYGLSGTSFVIGLTVLLGLQGVAFGIFYTSINMYIADEFSQERRGTTMGLSSLFGNISNIVIPLIFGLLADSFGTNRAYQFISGIAFVGVIFLLLLNKYKNSPQHKMI
jgi:MFS family permease